MEGERGFNVGYGEMVELSTDKKMGLFFKVGRTATSPMRVRLFMSYVENGVVDVHISSRRTMDRSQVITIMNDGRFMRRKDLPC